MLTPEHVVRIVLPDGVQVEGRPVELKADEMKLSVTRTSNRQLHPKGSVTVPRDAVKVVEVRKPRSKGRWIGVLAGAGPGSAIMATSSNVNNEFNVYSLLAGAAATAVGVPAGFFIGRAVDRRFQKFVVASK
ncbi:MAG: hypothetical protein HZB13_19855 [Acidobacteria bacterium]|nr:hypothetical protein [Acidobacteriota bacterium]